MHMNIMVPQWPYYLPLKLNNSTTQGPKSKYRTRSDPTNHKSNYNILLGLRALRQSNMPFDHFEHRKRLTMRTLDSLAALHTCHIFLQRGKPKHHLALESSMMWGRPPRPVPKEEGSNLIKSCHLYGSQFWDQFWHYSSGACQVHTYMDVDRPNIPGVAPIQTERIENSG